MQPFLFWKVLLFFFSLIILIYIKTIYYERKTLIFYGVGLNFRLSNMGGGQAMVRRALNVHKLKNIIKEENEIIPGDLKALENFYLIKLFTPHAVNIPLAIQVTF